MKFKKANFSKSEVLEILSFYRNSTDNVKISDLSGIANNNYRAKGIDFDYAIKVYSHGQSNREKIEKEIQAIEIFQKSGILIPPLITGLDQKILQEYKGFTIVTSEFIEGIGFEKIVFTGEKMYEVGKIVAQVELFAQKINVNAFPIINFREEFDDVNSGLYDEIKRRNYQFDLAVYEDHLPLIDDVIKKLDNSTKKQFLHKDIWPWNLIDSADGIYLLDFNDWAIGDPIIELTVALLEFGMFRSADMNFSVAKKIIEGYRSIKELPYSPKSLWESTLFMCYLYFAYNVIQADDYNESEVYLRRIKTLIDNPELFNSLL